MAGSTVKNLIKRRAVTPTPGVWCAGFAACKKYAIKNNLPFITAVVDGDGCSLCRAFAKASETTKFKTWMQGTGYVFWFGCKAYCKGEDGYKGAGWNWCYAHNRGGYYPGCRVYWEVNGNVKVDAFRDGVDNGRLACLADAVKQAEHNIDVFSKLLKDYKPPPPEPVKYTVTFDPNGGALDSASMTRTVAEGGKIGDLPSATRDGYAFGGWWTAKEGGTEISGQQTVTTNVTYYARWTEIPDSGGGEGGEGGGGGDQPQPPADPDKPLKSMFGLCKDCVIITKDNKILRYSAGEQAITLVGDYAPTALFATAKNIT